MFLSKQTGLREIVLECSDDFSELAESVLDALIEMDRNGPRLKNGSKIQFGWSVLTLQEENGRLRVCEPDFSGNISQNRLNIDTTLAVLKEQVSALRAAGEEGSDVSFTDLVAVAEGALSTESVFLKRDPPLSKADSGWFVGKLEDLEAAREATVQPVHVYEVLRSRPILVHVMTLPPGYLVIVRGEKVQAMLDQHLRVRWGKYP